MVPTFLASDDQNKSFNIEEGISFNTEGEVRMRSMMRTDMTMSSKKSWTWGNTCNLVRSDLLLPSGRRAKKPAGINFSTRFVVNFSAPKKHCEKGESLFLELKQSFGLADKVDGPVNGDSSSQYRSSGLSLEWRFHKNDYWNRHIGKGRITYYL